MNTLLQVLYTSIYYSANVSITLFMLINVVISFSIKYNNDELFFFFYYYK